MDRKTFGQLVAALRKEHFDVDGNRWTQAKLAENAAKIDPQTPLNDIIIGKIERGERAILDDATLLNLADTLQLTIGERREFFLLATGLDNEQIFASSGNATTILTTTLQTLQEIQLPTILLDTYLDIIAVNSQLLQLYQYAYVDLSQFIKQEPLNLIDLMFSDDFAIQRDLMGMRQWNDLAVGMVIYFRRVTLHYRMTDYFAHLLTKLRQHREFRWYWEQVFYEEKRYFVGDASLQIRSTDTEKLRYLTTPIITLTPFGNLELLTHIPRSPATAVAFQEMGQASPQVYRVSSWPDKPY